MNYKKWNMCKITQVLILWQIIVFLYFNKKNDKSTLAQSDPQTLPQTHPHTHQLQSNSCKSETTLSPPGYWTRASSHRSSLSYPLGHWHLTSKWQNKSICIAKSQYFASSKQKRLLDLSFIVYQNSIATLCDDQL